MTEASAVGSVPAKGSFVRATLAEVGRCPARADFVELRFTTDAGPWKWCFPDPGDRDARPEAVDDTLVLVLGRYGTQAHHVVDGAIGPALPSSEALPMILGGCRPFVSRALIEWGV
ncbi:hypothetical protein GCM10009836_00110 [Pseudonocardia ailaonensis]|uniref:Uncharacterized protein n=1 Tax=Pseudonocardia ailaonensis TaxID=367279 RepID=A0ABN2MHD0_9PSEU